MKVIFNVSSVFVEISMFLLFVHIVKYMEDDPKDLGDY